jgi:hypothetical protein
VPPETLVTARSAVPCKPVEVTVPMAVRAEFETLSPKKNAS